MPRNRRIRQGRKPIKLLVEGAGEVVEGAALGVDEAVAWVEEVEGVVVEEGVVEGDSRLLKNILRKKWEGLNAQGTKNNYSQLVLLRRAMMD